MKIPSPYPFDSSPSKNHEHLKNVIDTDHSCTYILGSTPCDAKHEAYVVFDKTGNENHFFYMKKDGFYSPDPDIAPLKMTKHEFRKFRQALNDDAKWAFTSIKSLHDEKLPVVAVTLLSGERVTINRDIVEMYVGIRSDMIMAKYNLDKVTAYLQDHIDTIVIMKLDKPNEIDGKRDTINICANSYDNLMYIIRMGIERKFDELQWEIDKL